MLNWYRGMRTWACEQRMLWLTLLVLLVLVPAYVLGTSTPACGEDRVRYAGTVLQVLGVSTVWWGIEKTRRLFGFEYTPIALWRWLRRVPLTAPGRNVTASLQGASMTMTGGRAHLSLGTTDTSVEARLRVLEQNVSAMESRFVADIEGLAKRLDGLKQSHEQATREQTARVTSVEQRLLAAQTGGLDLSLGGLVWLMVGIIATSIPHEVARLLGWP
jgi:hypothetical protein